MAHPVYPLASPMHTTSSLTPFDALSYIFSLCAHNLLLDPFYCPLIQLHLNVLVEFCDASNTRSNMMVVINPQNENLGAPYEGVHVAVADLDNHNVALGDNVAVHANVAVNAVDHNVAVQPNAPTNNDANDHSTVPGLPPDNDMNSNTGPEFIPLPAASSPIFVPSNVNMNYNDIPSSSNAQSIHTS
ncbi:unnamed protein product [Triticum turgidum subsp. durum]|uniref:Uncharacterized protein n=1 Tax=Triticum turgidum subsp. durum TaxID=4567 RepID=A0A9R0ZFF7_TRITD|nr:unnamed protein product [Triticum turgidum subsp. durum]